MEKYIMPELITPALEKILTSNPEILEKLLGVQTGGKAVAGRDFELNAGGGSTVLKFVFCNVNIKIDSPEQSGYGIKDGEDSDASGLSSKEEIRNIIGKIETIGRQLDEKKIQIEELSKDAGLLEDELLILETRIKESKIALKLINGAACSRKLSHKYKAELDSLCCRLRNKRTSLEEKNWRLKNEKEKRVVLEQESGELMRLLMKKLLQ